MDYEGWSDPEWTAWFRDEVMESERWKSLREAADSLGVGDSWLGHHEFVKNPRTGEEDESLSEAVRGLNRANKPDLADLVMSGLGRTPATRRWDLAFARLPLDLKLKFIEGWNRTEAGFVEADPEVTEPDDEGSGGDEGSLGGEELFVITLPGGGVIAVPVEQPPEADGGPMSEWIDQLNPAETDGGGTMSEWIDQLDPAETTDESEPSEPAETESIIGDLTHRMRGVGWRAGAVAGVAAAAAILGGFSLLGGEGAVTADSPSEVAISDQGEDAVSSGEVETDEGSVVTEGSCPAPAEPMTLSSDQIEATLPSLYDNPYDSNFAAPGFEWSGVPEGATELAIVIMRLDVPATDRTVDPWAEAVPEGAEDWIVTGIDPETTSLAPSSWDDPLPEGVSEWPAGAVEVQLPDGTMSRSKFIGPVYSDGYNLEGPYLFTVFALCDPNPDQPDAHMIGWIRRSSVARGWFYADVG